MKTIRPILRIASGCLALAASAIASHAQIIFQDTFETAVSGTLVGQTTSDGQATWSATLSSSNYQRSTVSWTETNSTVAASLGSYLAQTFNNANATTWMTASTNFDTIGSYAFNIGYLSLTSAGGTGTFGINARSTSNSLNSGFTFTLTANSASIGVNYVNASGVSTSLGTVTGTLSTRAGGNYYLTDVTVVVIGNTQQLYIGGVAYGSVVATQGAVDNGTTDQIRMYAKAGSGGFDVRLDNISATAIPEPSAAVLLTGLGALAFLATNRSRFRR